MDVGDRRTLNRERKKRNGLAGGPAAGDGVDELFIKEFYVLVKGLDDGRAAGRTPENERHRRRAGAGESHFERNGLIGGHRVEDALVAGGEVREKHHARFCCRGTLERAGQFKAHALLLPPGHRCADFGLLKVYNGLAVGGRGGRGEGRGRRGGGGGTVARTAAIWAGEAIGPGGGVNVVPARQTADAKAARQPREIAIREDMEILRGALPSNNGGC